MAVTPKKQQELKSLMEQWGVRESDLQESFVRGGGKGGQKINKTNNCVCLIHEPSGIVIRCHREREREINRYLARRALCDELEYLSSGIRPQRKPSGSNKQGKKSPTRNISVLRRKQS